jgi:hypothetical protein
MSPRRRFLLAALAIATAAAILVYYSRTTGGEMGRYGIDPPPAE